MNVRTIATSLGSVLLTLGISLLLPLSLALYEGDAPYPVYLIPCMAGILTGVGLILLGRGSPVPGLREAPIIVVFTWVVAGIFGALPYQVYGAFPSYLDALFESVSGFTATGSTVLTDIEALPRSLLLWRSLTHWLGGMGIVVLAIAIFPSISLGGKILFGAEAPLPLVEEKVAPRIRDVSRTYWLIYVFFTIALILFLTPAVGLYEAVNHALATIAGGGFSTQNTSIAAFDSLYVEIVIELGMIAGATSFILHFRALRGAPRVYWSSGEFRLFIAILATGIGIVTILLLFQRFPFGHALRVATFQVISITSTTGFATDDFELWPAAAQLLLVIVMFFGGTLASTSGSIKCGRHLVNGKRIFLDMRKLLHPSAIFRTRLMGHAMALEQVGAAQLYIVIYVFTFALIVLGFTATGVDIQSATSGTAALLGNVGPGLGQLGPYDNFAWLSPVAKAIAIAAMLLGRLEIYTILVLFIPTFWKK